MQKIGGILLIGIAGFAAQYAQAAQPTCGIGGCTITAPGSYTLTGNITGLTISANNVVLDLSGYAVTQYPQGSLSCAIVTTYRGNSCSGATSGSPAISVSGSNVTIKNGIVNSGRSTGIYVAAANSNIALKDVTVSNFLGNGIDVSNAAVATLSNVQSNQNGGLGVFGNLAVTLSQVTANYNNSTGIQLNSGMSEDVTASYNKGGGIVSAGTITKAHVESNGAGGISGAAVIRDAYVAGNVGDGVWAVAPGVVTNSIAQLNGGNGFSLAPGVCYWGLSTTSNTGSAISGGTPLSGGVASCQ